jgi:hypothetical protein
MHDNAYTQELQVLNACVTPGCYKLPLETDLFPLASGNSRI